MTVTQMRRVEYPAPEVPQPLEGTLLSIVTPVEFADTGKPLISNPEGLFASFSCLDMGTELPALCGRLDESKFEGAASPTWQDGYAFGTYGAVVCKMIDEDEIVRGLDLAYDAAEARVVERGLLRLMEANDPDDDPGDVGYIPGGWDAAVDITPVAFDGTGVDPVVGLGLLESHMGVNYAGRGIIHATRSTATWLAQQGAIDWQGSQLVTSLRTPLAAGPGYDLPSIGPDGSDAPAGTKWMYATGNIVIRKQRLATRAVLNIFGQSEDDEAPNYVPGLEPNDMVGLAESIYLVAVDCYKAAVLVKLYEEA